MRRCPSRQAPPRAARAAAQATPPSRSRVGPDAGRSTPDSAACSSRLKKVASRRRRLPSRSPRVGPLNGVRSCCWLRQKASNGGMELDAEEAEQSRPRARGRRRPDPRSEARSSGRRAACGRKSAALDMPRPCEWACLECHPWLVRIPLSHQRAHDVTPIANDVDESRARENLSDQFRDSLVVRVGVMGVLVAPVAGIRRKACGRSRGSSAGRRAAGARRTPRAGWPRFRSSCERARAWWSHANTRVSWLMKTSGAR